MRRIAIVVEGQTESAFVESVLQPYLGWQKVSLNPIIVPTKLTPSGGRHRGGGKWAHYVPLLRNLLGQSH